MFKKLIFPAGSRFSFLPPFLNFQTEQVGSFKISSFSEGRSIKKFIVDFVFKSIK
jgi:hypothetical protein